MNKYKQSADRLKESFKWVDTRGMPNELAMPFGNGYSGKAGKFRAGDYEDLKTITEYVKLNIPESEWRKGMNLIAQERKQYFNVRPNPLYVAMQEARGILEAYAERQKRLAEGDDERDLPEELKTMPIGLSVYAFEKIDGLAGLVSVLNDDAIKGHQYQIQIQTLKQK